MGWGVRLPGTETQVYAGVDCEALAEIPGREARYSWEKPVKSPGAPSRIHVMRKQTWPSLRSLFVFVLLSLCSLFWKLCVGDAEPCKSVDMQMETQWHSHAAHM